MRTFIFQLAGIHLERLFFRRGREYVPKPQRLVTGACDNRGPVRAHRQVQNSKSVPCQSGYLLHFGASPDIDFILTVAVGTDQLVEMSTEGQVTHLRANVHGFDCFSGQGVSEFDRSVGSSSSRNKESVLVRGPGHGLDCSQMIVVLVNRLGRVIVPYEQFVIIAARANLLLIRGPLQPANLLLVMGQFSLVAFPHSGVTLVDDFISGTRAETVAAPRD